MMVVHAFFTGRGDRGITSLLTTRRGKSHEIFEVLGSLDELNSLLGFVKNHKQLLPRFKKVCEDIQQKLFIIQAQFVLTHRAFKQDAKRKRVRLQNIMLCEKEVRTLEGCIAWIEKKMDTPHSFVIPGAVEIAGLLDYTRAVARRVERTIVRFGRHNNVAPEIHAYMNRLSSTLFAMARYEVKRRNVKEKHPTYK